VASMRPLPRSASFAALISLFLLIGSLPPEKNTHWQLIGPGGGGALFQPTVNPQDPNRVLVACDMTGSYITTNGGRSWRMFNLRGRVRWFVWDPNNKDVVYARSIGLWRSTDGAQTWKLLYPAPESVVAIKMPDDHAGESLQTREPVGTITGLAVDPADSNVLYAILRNSRSDEVVQSRNFGSSWTRIAPVPESARQIYADPGSANNDRTLYVILKNSIFRREKGQWRNGASPPGIDAFLDVSIGFSFSGAPTIYATTRQGIFVSRDRGASWSKSDLPGSGAYPRAIAASPGHPEIGYVSYGGLKEGWFGGDKTFSGVARTEDTGKHWKVVWKEADQPAANVRDSWITRFFGPDYGGVALDLAVAAHDPNIAYATDQGRIMRTLDGGRNWDAIYSTQQPDGTFSGQGLESSTSYGVHSDPFDPKRLFISYTDIGLFRSENSGRSWIPSLSGVPRSWRNTTYWMVFDPEVRGRIWAVMSKTHDLPRAKMWKRQAPANYDGGVMLSDDSGQSWRKASTGMPPTAPTHIILDPRSKPGSRVLYVAAFGEGVYKSTDDGKTWTVKNNGISGKDPFAWRLALAASGELYLIVARRSEDGSFGNENDGAIYRSSDGAEHWTKVAMPSGTNGPNGLSIDVHDSKRLYLAAWGRNTPPRAQGGGVFLTTDAGRSWQNVLAKDQHVYDVTIDARDPKVIYAAGFESSAWRSSDRGLTWKRIPGFNFKWGHRVIPDPQDASKIYITTFGGGVWHGSATGDGTAVDEIASREVAHGR